MSFAGRLALSCLSLTLWIAGAARAGSGSAEVKRVGNALKIQADTAISLNIEGSSTFGHVMVTGNNTLLNGQSAPLTFDGVESIGLRSSFQALVEFDDLQLNKGISVQGKDALLQVDFNATQLNQNLSISSNTGVSLGCASDTLIRGSLSVKAGPPGSVLHVDCVAVKSMKLALGDGDHDVQFEGNADSLSLVTGKGDDSVSFNAATVTKSVKLDLGDGVNQVDVDQSALTDLSVTTGNGGDSFSAEFSSVSGKLSLALGNGLNNSTLDHVLAGAKSLAVTGGSGDDGFSCSNCSSSGNASLKLGSGDNHSSFSTSEIDGNLSVSGGAGDDLVELLDGTVIGGKTHFSLGAGNNTTP
jgi:hypothetical protein